PRPLRAYLGVGCHRPAGAAAHRSRHLAAAAARDDRLARRLPDLAPDRSHDDDRLPGGHRVLLPHGDRVGPDRRVRGRAGTARGVDRRPPGTSRPAAHRHRGPRRPSRRRLLAARRGGQGPPRGDLCLRLRAQLAPHHTGTGPPSRARARPALPRHPAPDRHRRPRPSWLLHRLVGRRSHPHRPGPGDGRPADAQPEPRAASRPARDHHLTGETSMATTPETAVPAAAPPGPTRRRKKRDDTRLALVFIAAASVGLIAFYLVPLVRGVWLSFQEWDLLSEASFVGLANYERMVADPVFWNAVRVTLPYVVINIGVQTVIGLGIAVLMQRLATSTFWRSIVLAPYLVSNVVAAILFLWILDFQLGIGTQVLEWIGVGRIPFLTSEEWAIPTIALINVWRHMGYTALLLFAGLQTIPPVLYEAARIDGASEWRMFRSITMPVLRPMLGMVLIVSIIGSFQVFDTVSVTTNGGPVDASRVLQLYIYENAFAQFDFGYAS